MGDPHTFRRTVATLISEATTSKLASRQLGHSSSQVTRDHYIAKPPISADLSGLLERLAASDDPSATPTPTPAAPTGGAPPPRKDAANDLRPGCADGVS
jgi:hypothetical protein